MLTRRIADLDFRVPREPDERSRRSEECVREVLERQIYSHPDTRNDVRSLVDVGCNVGAFIVWARRWWPNLETVEAYDPNIDALAVAARNIIPSGAVLHHAAVTIDPSPLFHEETDWGGSRTYGQTEGVAVPALHPRDLPPCDVLKVDAEGVEQEIFGHYAHWAGVKVCCFEYHETRFRKSMMGILHDAGLVMRRGNPLVVEVDTQVWVRP